MESKTNKDGDICLGSQKSLGNQDDLSKKPRITNKDDQTKPINESKNPSQPCNTNKANNSSTNSQIKQKNDANLQCPNNKENQICPEFLTRQGKGQLRPAFHLDGGEEEIQDFPDIKKMHNRNLRQNKTKQISRKCQKDNISIPGLCIDAVVKKNVDNNLTQLSGTGPTCIQYGNTSYMSYHTDHPYWAAGHNSLSAYQTGIYRSRNIKGTQVVFSFYLILIQG